MNINQIVDTDKHDLSSALFASKCKQMLDEQGVLSLNSFLTERALEQLQIESLAGQPKAYFCTQNHTTYLSPPDQQFADDHPRNRMVESSKGCICDDAIAQTSVLRVLYDSDDFRSFIAIVTGEQEIHPYADPLSSINIHYAEREQELGWHFDNSSFAITLLIQKPTNGSLFEFVKDLRDAEIGDMNFQGVGELLDGVTKPEVLPMEPGTLVLFRGRNSIHRVSPNESDVTRILAVLAYNSKPGVELSENARMTFYGRLG
ncbi:MAG: 2OG-Fe(II) oxygenase [Rhizobiaceae bacterium]